MSFLHKLSERPRLIFGEPIKREISFYRVRPKTALFYLTFRCNSKCTTCTFWLRDKKKLEKGELTLEQWTRIVDQLHENGFRNVELFGGNVLIRKDLLIPLLHHLHKLKWNVYIPTNQIGLDQKTIEAFVETEVAMLYISTDGVAEYQNKIRGFEGADNLNTKSIRAIRDYREQLGKTCPKLVCNTTISKFNVDIFEKIPDYAIEMGFDEVHFEYVGEMDDEVILNSLIDGLKPTPMFVQQNGESILASKKQARIIKMKLKRIKRQYRNAPIAIITINIDDLSEENLYKGTIPHKKCYDERIEVNIDPYGNIVACPIIHNYAYGNLLSEDFKNIWNNQRHKRFRTLQNCGNLPMCDHCILGVQRNPTLWRSVKRNFKMYGIDAFYRFISSKKMGKFNNSHSDKNHVMDSSNSMPELNEESLLTIGKPNES